MTELVYVGLGANLKSPLETIKLAINELTVLPHSELVGVSKIYSSKPMGPADQPDYINAVALIRTELTPHQLFSHTCAIEDKHGRTRVGEHWGPRTLDLDILLYGQHQINDEQLVVPHYGLQQREFVIYPLLDITPDLVLPCGTIVESLTKNIPLNGMTPLLSTY
ncbi:MAG: 2-amino-4-hydroxy-6-hydroxymethyldihydropteridine diphosphokinase [Psychrosphaera sp.]|jgi:2-amino-4-hydroxy-6-hydroxymethyldihydropteridine diphosphokinase